MHRSAKRNLTSLESPRCIVSQTWSDLLGELKACKSAMYWASPPLLHVTRVEIIHGCVFEPLKESSWSVPSKGTNDRGNIVDQLSSDTWSTRGSQVGIGETRLAPLVCPRGHKSKASGYGLSPLFLLFTWTRVQEGLLEAIWGCPHGEYSLECSIPFLLGIKVYLRHRNRGQSSFYHFHLTSPWG